jgi:hypothetical protein
MPQDARCLSTENRLCHRSYNKRAFPQPAVMPGTARFAAAAGTCSAHWAWRCWRRTASVAAGIVAAHSDADRSTAPICNVAIIRTQEAATLTGKSRTTIWRAIKAGRLSASRTDSGDFEIDAAELERVFGVSRTAGCRCVARHVAARSIATTCINE